MNKFLSTSLAVVLGLSSVVGTIGCSTVPTSDIKSQAVTAPTFHIGDYKSYGWLGGAAALRDPHQVWSLPGLDVLAETQYLLNEEMRGRGLNESPQPDLLVAFLLVNDVAELKQVKDERGVDLPELVGVGEGALLIEFVDAKTGHSVWLGAATAETQTGRDAETVKARLKFAVESVFGHVPK